MVKSLNQKIALTLSLAALRMLGSWGHRCFIAFLALFISFSAKGSSLTCSDLFTPVPTGWALSKEFFGETEVPFFYLEKSHPHIKKLQGRTVVPAKFVDVDSADDLFIGFSSLRNHAYIVFRGQRLDGGFALNPLKIEPLKIKHNTDLLESGVFLRFKTLPPEIKNSLEEYLSERNWGLSITCIRGVCGALNSAAGLKPVGQLSKGLMPFNTISRLVKKGLKDEQGNIYRPEVYVIGGDSFKSYYKQGALADATQMTAGGALLLGASMMYHILSTTPY